MNSPLYYFFISLQLTIKITAYNVYNKTMSDIIDSRILIRNKFMTKTRDVTTDHINKSIGFLGSPEYITDAAPQYNTADVNVNTYTYLSDDPLSREFNYDKENHPPIFMCMYTQQNELSLPYISYHLVKNNNSLAFPIAVPTISGGGTPDDNDAIVPPESVGLDPVKLQALDTEIADGKHGMVDLIEIFRCGKRAFSRRYPRDYSTIYKTEASQVGPLNQRLTGPYNYFDSSLHPYKQGSEMHSIQSITKTITSIVVGVAITRGDFRAPLDTPVLNWFDETKVLNVDDRKRKMTLRHILTMTSGLEWEEKVPYADTRSDSSRMEGTDDWVTYTINKPMASEPGMDFNYSSGASQLLAHIFLRETGTDIDAYAGEHLFAPLGINYHWKRSYDGTTDTEGGLFMSGLDLIKIGHLMLDDGVWQGQQIVSKSWIQDSLTSSVPENKADKAFSYGYQWWLYHRPDNGRIVWTSAGMGGQMLLIFPEERLVVTVLSWNILSIPVSMEKIIEHVISTINADCGEDGDDDDADDADYIPPIDLELDEPPRTEMPPPETISENAVETDNFLYEQGSQYIKKYLVNTTDIGHECYKGFVESAGNIYLFFDITDIELTNEFSDNHTNCIIDELVNKKRVLDLPVGDATSSLFATNHKLIYVYHDKTHKPSHYPIRVYLCESINDEYANVKYVDAGDKSTVSMISDKVNDQVVGNGYLFTSTALDVSETPSLKRYALFHHNATYVLHEPFIISEYDLITDNTCVCFLSEGVEYWSVKNMDLFLEI
jgi:CubicO group peptidase (beta-lactamase class C family)